MPDLCPLGILAISLVPLVAHQTVSRYCEMCGYQYRIELVPVTVILVLVESHQRGIYWVGDQHIINLTLSRVRHHRWTLFLVGEPTEDFALNYYTNTKHCNLQPKFKIIVH